MNLFRSKEKRFRQAIAANDFQEMERVLQKKGISMLFTVIDSKNYDGLTAEMAQFLCDKIDTAAWQRWGLRDANGLSDTQPRFLLAVALRQKRYDIVDLMLERSLGFNSGAANEHVVASFIRADMNPEDKLRRIRKALSMGYDKIENPDYFPLLAVETGFREGVALFANIGFNLHKNNELLLRTAAKAGQRDMCLYLIHEQHADVDLAIRTGRELGCEAEWLFLQQLKTDSPAGEKKPATIESMSADIDELKATVKALTALVNDMRTPEMKLDKPGLIHPKGAN